MLSFKTWCENNGDFGKKVLADYIDSKDISKIGYSSKTKLKFRCTVCNHEFERAPGHVTRKRECPYCNKHNNCIDTISLDSDRRIINSYPEIAAEYIQEMNEDPLIDILVTSYKAVWWRCSKCGNKWIAYVGNRVNKHSGCPECSKGNQGSFMEYALYLILKDTFKDAEYQFKINGMSFDIGIPEPATVIEYQGRYYHNNEYNDYNVEKRDSDKRKFVESYKNIKFITVNETYGGDKIRTIHNDIYFNADNKDKEEILKMIILELEKLLNIKIGIRDDIITYTTQNLQLKEIDDSLATRHPDLIAEWDYIKNRKLKPTQIKPKSNKKVWWHCSKCGFDWRTSPAHRVADGTGCPKCLALRGSGSGTHMVIEGVNDLKSLYPSIAEEWETELNNEMGLSLDKIAAQSNKAVWWKCKHCGHVYFDKVVYRTKRNHNCPICSIKHK